MKKIRKLVAAFVCLLALLITQSAMSGSSVSNNPIIASGTIAANLLNISAVDGTAFLDPTSDATASAAFIAAVSRGDYIEIISVTSGAKIGGFAKKYMAVFYDSTGAEVGMAYLGQAGGGKTLGAEINSGTLTSGKLYEITATEVNHFGTGLVVGNAFTSNGTETCDANNKVKNFTDIVNTGLFLYNSLNGSTRGMARTGSGNPNTITKVNIYRTGS
jgi:hypothetical protein